MKYKTIFKLLSALLLIISGFLCIPLAAAFYFSDPTETVQAFFIPLGVSMVFFMLMRLFFWDKEKAFLPPRSGFLFVTLSWLSASFLGALPFYFSRIIPGFANCFFEAMSGFSTTGATILLDIEGLPKSLLLWRSMMHWLGGMGIVVLTVAIFPLLGVGGLHLMAAEAPGPSVDKITPRAAGTAKMLWLIYLGFTLAETLLLRYGGMSWFDAVNHSFSTLATGGFSTRNRSIAHYNSVFLEVVITVFMVLAGMNFANHYKIFTGRFREAFRDTELRVYLGVLLLASLTIAWNLYNRNYGNFPKSYRFASFQTVSMMTGAGLVAADYSLWADLSQAVLFVLMFIGGCAGSTGGGIKVIRILTLLKMSFTEMKYLLRPQGVFGIFVNGKYLRKNIVYDIAALIFLYFVVFFVVVVLVASAGTDILTSISSAIACLGNVGPGFGKIGPALNYFFFPDYIKWVLSFTMLIGRLEVYTVLVLLTPTFWKN